MRESSETMRKVLEMYNDSLTHVIFVFPRMTSLLTAPYTCSAAAATQGQLCEHVGKMIGMISPQRDSAAIAASIPRLLAAASPKPVYYYNYNVGECKDLIFGVSLVDYATARGPLEGDIPKIVKMCIEDIDRRGLDAEGIYRVWVCSRESSHLYIDTPLFHRFQGDMQRSRRCAPMGIAS